MNKRYIISIPLICILFSGCANLNANLGKVSGTAIGAAAGGAIGKEVAGKKGMLIGIAVGAVAGYFIGDYIDRRRAEQDKISKQYDVEIKHEDVKTTDQKGDKASIVINENQFASGESKLNPKAEEYFTLLAKTYENSNQKILIIGHSDDSGTSAFNQNLSEARAKTVGEVFSENGTNINDIYYWGAGEAQPIADINSQEGRMKNRRVEVVTVESESDIAKYAQKINVNPSFFTKINQESKNTLAEDKITSLNDSKKVITEQKNDITTNDNSVVSKKEEDIKSKIAIKKDIKPAQNLANFVDFGGQKAQDFFALDDQFGGKKKSWFSFGTKAYASGEFMSNCTRDKYHEESGVKKLSNQQELPKISEYRKGLYHTVWQVMLNNNMLVITPVSLLKDGGKSSEEPKIYVRKNYIEGDNKEADLKLQGKVNTYEGENGLLYRVFIDEKSSPIKCLDIVFDNKEALNANGYVYYVSQMQNGLMQKDFKLSNFRSR